MKSLKLGTRRSLLAMAQSGWVAKEIERLNPEFRVELVGIETRGDQIQDIPLQKVEGKDFFVAELDRALISKEVDLCVHSMKDLSLERPDQIVRAAIPRREHPHDVVLFAPDIDQRLGSGEPIRVGTSSPRRIENVPPFLMQALPEPHGPLEFTEIRGNVNTRLARVHEPVDSDRRVDAVVLAFAGLIRLWADDEARQELSKHLRGVRWMILPLIECPSAPAQGALSVECRTEDQETRAALAKLNDAFTMKQVARERAILEELGGGCHQRFGATSFHHEEIGDVFSVRGVDPSGASLNRLEWNAPPPPHSAGIKISSWNGGEWRSVHTETEYLPMEPNHLRSQGGVTEEGTSFFVAHSRAIPPNSEKWTQTLKAGRIWTSGVRSWRKLAQAGIWVEGCAEGLGFDALTPVLVEPVLRLPELSRWTVLTHEQSAHEWSGIRKMARVLATYRLKSKSGEQINQAVDSLKRASHIYWASGSQFELLHAHVKADAHHACGPGRTAQILRTHGIKPSVFPSEKEWKKWISQ